MTCTRVFDRLAERVKIQRASKVPAAGIFKDDANPPKAILITDPGITDKKHPEALLEHLFSICPQLWNRRSPASLMRQTLISSSARSSACHGNLVTTIELQ